MVNELDELKPAQTFVKLNGKKFENFVGKRTKELSKSPTNMIEPISCFCCLFCPKNAFFGQKCLILAHFFKVDELFVQQRTDKLATEQTFVGAN